MKYGIIVDSSCDLTELPDNQNQIFYDRAALKIRVGEKEYIDNLSLDLKDFMTDMENCKTTTGSSAPSPEDWYNAYIHADEIFALTISGKLSGSYNSAVAGMNMLLENYPDKKIHVIDSLSTGPEMTLAVYKLQECMKQNMPFEDIKDTITEYMKHTHLYCILESLDNLVRNGRVNKIVGNIAGMLGIKILGQASNEGTIDILQKCRGRKSVYDNLIKQIQSKYTTLSKVVISHCFNEEGAKFIKEKILSIFPKCVVTIMPTGGLCSYYAERNGLIIGISE